MDRRGLILLQYFEEKKLTQVKTLSPSSGLRIFFIKFRKNKPFLY